MDGVDFQHEIGCASGGNVIYPSIEDLKEYSSCWEGCGIVECEVTFKEWIVPQDWSHMKETAVPAIEMENPKRQIEHAEKRLEYLENMVSKQKHKVIEMKANLKKGKK